MKGRSGTRTAAVRHLAPVRFEAVGLSRSILALVDLFRAPIRMLGVDYAPFRTLLEASLILDGRRAQHAKSEGDKTAMGAGLALSCVLNVFIGLFAGIAIVSIDDALWGMAMAELAVMVIVTMMLVSDYVAVFLDTTDIDLVGPTPVADRTLYAARVAHIVVYLGLVVGSLSVMPLLLGSYRHGLLFVPVWLVATSLATLLCIALSFGLYLLAMRLFDMERFKDLVLYVQVGAMILFIGGFQLLPLILRLDDVGSLFSGRSWGMALAPPFHCGGLLALVLGDASPLTITLAGLAIGLPLLLFLATLRLSATGFVAKLASMAVGARSAATVRPRWRPLRNLLLRSPTGRAGYDFVAALSTRERQFRMRTYPMIAVAAVAGLGFAVRSGEFEPGRLCGALYLLALYEPMIVLQARYSESHEGRWVFQAAPLAHPADFMLGGFVALLCRFLAPAWVVLLAVVVAVGGTGVLLDALFASEVLFATAVVSVLVFGSVIPFTFKQEKKPGADRIGTFLAMALLVGLFMGGHVVLRMFDTAFYTALVALPVACIFLASLLRRLRPNPRWLQGK